MSVIGSAVFVAPLVAVLESVAIARSVAKGQRVDASQEMIAIGASNLIGSFVSSFPVTGSFSRTAVNSASGVSTALGGVYTGYQFKLIHSSMKITATLFYVKGRSFFWQSQSSRLTFITSPRVAWRRSSYAQ